MSPNPSPTRRWRRRAAVLLAVLALVVTGSYVATTVAKVPPPHALATLLTALPSSQGDLFADRAVPAPTSPRVLPEAAGASLPGTVPWKGKQLPVSDVLAKTETNAFVVLHNGAVVKEWYRKGFDASTRMSSWSVAKSVVSLLVGQAIGRGELAEDDRLVDLVPNLKKGTAYDDITVRDLLDMSSGVDVPENYNEYWPFTGTARLFLTKDLRGYVASHRDLTFKPGSQTTYRSVDTQLLGIVLAAATHKPVAQLLSEELWTPMGAEAAATWNLDQPGGIEKAFCCLNATARDFSRIGQVVLDGGRANGEQVVPEAWIERISTPGPHKIDGWGYSAQWWHPPGSTGDFTAIGIYGQYIYVNPAANTVIVKVSDYGTEQDERETVEAMRSIAEHLAVGQD